MFIYGIWGWNICLFVKSGQWDTWLFKESEYWDTCLSIASGHRDTWLSSKSRYWDTCLSSKYEHWDTCLSEESGHKDTWLSSKSGHWDTCLSNKCEDWYTCLSSKSGHWETCLMFILYVCTIVYLSLKNCDRIWVNEWVERYQRKLIHRSVILYLRAYPE